MYIAMMTTTTTTIIIAITVITKALARVIQYFPFQKNIVRI